jgi:hypothetical protein
LESNNDNTNGEEVEATWKQIADAFTETANDKLGHKEIGQKPSITRDSWKKVDERRYLKNKIAKARSGRLK